MVDVLLFSMQLDAIVQTLSVVITVNLVCFILLIFSLYRFLKYLARKRTIGNTACANVTCMNGGECVVNENGPQCTCPKPYYGARCESSE